MCQGCRGPSRIINGLLVYWSIGLLVYWSILCGCSCTLFSLFCRCVPFRGQAKFRNFLKEQCSCCLEMFLYFRLTRESSRIVYFSVPSTDVSRTETEMEMEMGMEI